MRVFLSWSGDLSKAVANVLTKWLPTMLPDARPWMSAHDIQAGAAWEEELTDNLEGSDCGVLVLTRENRGAPWLLFEAGALSKSANRKRVIPYRVDLSLAEVPSPLLRFQGVEADREGTKRLVTSLNAVMAHPIAGTHLLLLFDIYWPNLEPGLEAAKAISGKAPDGLRRSLESYLDEILGLLRTSGIPATPERANESGAELAIQGIRSEVQLLEQKISSMEEYERNGGGASLEPWWDGYVDRHRTARSVYEEALGLLEKAKNVRLTV